VRYEYWRVYAVLSQDHIIMLTIRIIALMLGRLRMSTNECIDAYLEMSKTVFGQTQGFTHREKFSPEALEQAIQDIVKRKTGDENAFLMDPACCKT